MIHVVGFSGGIDSQACSRWVLNRHSAEDVILLNSDAGGNEHPITTAFVEWYSENIHPVTVVTPLVRIVTGKQLVSTSLGRSCRKLRIAQLN